ncbi:MAG: tRNA (adenosine(37)-N6)-threonylcarbamoyltransferase complex ATPase subunit type 1 TsaE [Verrucomicrobiota bacterium]
MPDLSFETRNEEETLAAGRSFATELAAGDVVALTGDLGAGKTHFSKGVVAGLGSSDLVTSPTFSLVNEYRSGRLPVFHFDFYRIEAIEELIDLGWDDYLEREGVVLVEWPDRFPELLPPTARELRFKLRSDDSRLIFES